MKRLPKNCSIYQLRGKRGRKHIIVYQVIVNDENYWRWESCEKIIGPVAWYRGRSKSKMKRVTDWFEYW